MEKSMKVNGASEENIKLLTVEEKKICLVCLLPEEDGKNSLRLFLGKCNWIHMVCLQRWLAEVQGEIELKMLSTSPSRKNNNTDHVTNHNGTPNMNSKVPVAKVEGCIVCLRCDKDDQDFLLLPCKWNGFEWIHVVCLQQWLKEVQEKNEFEKITTLQHMKCKDTPEQGSTLESNLINQVKVKSHSLDTDKEKMNSSKNVSVIRYYKLKMLLHKAAENLNYPVEVALNLFGNEFDSLDWKTKSLKHGLPAKSVILWDLSSKLTALKAFSTSSSGLQFIEEIEQLTETLEKVKFNIDIKAYEEYYRKIESLLDRMGVFASELEHLNPGRKVICFHSKLKSLGWSRGICKAISGCEDFCQMIKLAFGPTKLGNDNQIKDYIKEQLFESDSEQPEIRKMISAAKKQQEKFGDGTKFMIILCAQLVIRIKYFLRFGLSPKEVKSGYIALLTQTIKILDSLWFEMDVEAVKNSGKSFRSCKYLAGGGATESELFAKLKLLGENKNMGRAIEGFLTAFIEVPITLLENNGLSALDIIIEIQEQHMKGEKHFGCDIKGDYPFLDTKKGKIIDHYFAKRYAIKQAVHSACEIIDEYDLQAANKRLKTLYEERTEIKGNLSEKKFRKWKSLQTTSMSHEP